MPTTRRQVETHLCGPDLLSGQRGRVCARLKLYDPNTAAPGAVPALAGPIAGAMRFLGVEPADPTDPTDDELAALPAGSTEALLAVADMLLLERCLGNASEPDQQISMGMMAWGKFHDSLSADLRDLRAACRDRFGYGLGSPVAGSIPLGFAASAPRWGLPPC